MPKLNLFLLIGMFFASYVITYIIIPRIIGVVTYKRLMDEPNARSSHSKKIPSLGGLAFYIVLVLGLYFAGNFDMYDCAKAVTPGLMILFIIGLKDDLTVLSPLTKLGAQLVSISFVLAHHSFQFNQMHGFLGIFTLSHLITIPLSAFVMIVIINAYNLIDGIDGLAAIIGIVIFIIFGFLFYEVGLYFFLYISVVLIASLMAFLNFNLSSKRKIFMGDTGSLVLGFMIAVMMVRLFSVDVSRLKMLPFQLENLPLIILALLIVPFFDTARVFTIRLINGQSPFSPDRNHIHHMLIDYLKLSHKSVSFIIGAVNVIFVFVFILLGANVDNILLFGLFLLFVVVFSFFFFHINYSYSSLKKKLLVKKLFKKIKKRLLKRESKSTLEDINF